MREYEMTQRTIDAEMLCEIEQAANVRATQPWWLLEVCDSEERAENLARIGIVLGEN
jgi:hypothetical protein